MDRIATHVQFVRSSLHVPFWHSFRMCHDEPTKGKKNVEKMQRHRSGDNYEKTKSVSTQRIIMLEHTMDLFAKQKGQTPFRRNLWTHSMTSIEVEVECVGQ